MNVHKGHMSMCPYSPKIMLSMDDTITHSLPEHCSSFIVDYYVHNQICESFLVALFGVCVCVSVMCVCVCEDHT
jgi:hypothetical protein